MARLACSPYEHVLDQGLIVTPPPGLEVGYVPICVHQQKADQQPAVFPNIDRIKPGR